MALTDRKKIRFRFSLATVHVSSSPGFLLPTFNADTTDGERSALLKRPEEASVPLRP